MAWINFVLAFHVTDQQLVICDLLNDLHLMYLYNVVKVILPQVEVISELL